MKKYKISNLMQRYSITRQAVIKFIQKNLDSINRDGKIHAQKKNGEWVLDEEAVVIMDDLRDTGNITIVEENNEKIEELTLENTQLKEALISTQSKLIETQENLNINQNKIMSIQTELVETQKQLKSITLELKDNQNKVMLNEVEIKTSNRYAEELKIALSRITQLEEELSKLRKRGLLDRIFNKE